VRLNGQLGNFLLESLPASVLDAIRPRLRPVALTQRLELARAGEPSDDVYFPQSGIISLVVRLSGGEAIEVAMVGRESVFGASAALGGGVWLSDAVVQLPGVAWVLDAAHLRRVVQSSDAFRATLFRHGEAIFAQAQQSAACNAVHSLENRFASWLLRARDLSGADDLLLTQEFLAEMIGVQRGSVSTVASSFQRDGLLRYHRGKIEILDVEGLGRKACECYASIKAQYARLVGGSDAPEV
jgi:CRP-like cAMP-binding protein